MKEFARTVISELIDTNQDELQETKNHYIKLAGADLKSNQKNTWHFAKYHKIDRKWSDN